MKIETLIHQTLGNHNFCIFTTFLIFTLFNQNFGDKKITEVHLRKLRADYFFHNVCFLQCVLYVLATVWRAQKNSFLQGSLMNGHCSYLAVMF